jgi:hypothetical protein
MVLCCWLGWVLIVLALSLFALVFLADSLIMSYYHHTKVAPPVATSEDLFCNSCTMYHDLGIEMRIK